MHPWTSRTIPGAGAHRDERSRWLRPLLLVSCVALAGCRPSWADSAGAKFAEDVSCPEHRVVVATRFYQAPHVDPPPYIASDPERLSMWQTREDSLERPRPYFVVDGCGEEHDVLLPADVLGAGPPQSRVRGRVGLGEPGHCASSTTDDDAALPAASGTPGPR